MANLPMKTVKDDFTGKEHEYERNIAVQISFSNSKVYYKANIDISPETYMKLFGQTRVPFGKYIKHTSEELKKEYAGTKNEKGHYEPVKNANAIIATMIEEEITQ